MASQPADSKRHNQLIPRLPLSARPCHLRSRRVMPFAAANKLSPDCTPEGHPEDRDLCTPGAPACCMQPCPSNSLCCSSLQQLHVGTGGDVLDPAHPDKHREPSHLLPVGPVICICICGARTLQHDRVTLCAPTAEQNSQQACVPHAAAPPSSLARNPTARRDSHLNSAIVPTSKYESLRPLGCLAKPQEVTACSPSTCYIHQVPAPPLVARWP
jgi:hypothetical protein